MQNQRYITDCPNVLGRNAAILPPGFSTITSANGGFEFVPVTPNSTTTVKIGLH